MKSGMREKQFRWQQGFTIVEVLVVIVLIGVAVLLFSSLNRAKSRGARIDCVNNLKQMGVGFRSWALDNNNAPLSISDTNINGTAYLYFRAMSNQLGTPKILWCQADKRKTANSFLDGFSNSNVSYFVSLNAVDIYPSMFLDGDRNLTSEPLPSSRIFELKSNSVVGWTKELHNGTGNIGLADGSVQTMTTSALRESVVKLGDLTNRLAIP